MTKHKDICLDDLLKRVAVYLDEKDINIIKKSYEYASKIYFGSKRLTGDDYINHPLNVAYILTDINADAVTISAALVHDVYKFSECLDLEEQLGSEIKSLVDGVNKIKKLNFDDSTESTISMQRKILVGLTDDVRVIIIRLAEKLHDMRTLWVHSEKEQREDAKETLDILTPIAHRLGMNKFKSELEDLSLRYLKPDIYFDIVDRLNQTKQERDNSVKEMLDAVSKILDEAKIKHSIKGRSKSIYSIYKKLDRGKKFSEIYDLLALRVYVETEAECYQALGVIHAKFKPLPKRFKDYIAMPKTNMYQSLHTTVIGTEGYLYEIQIRTYKMDEVAESGIAAHYSYKEHGSKVATKNNMEEKLQFFRSIIELNNEDTTDEEFVSSIKQEFKSTIYVFTPIGDVIELPKDSTPIDFAYKVHSAVGDKMVGALVNNVLVPLDYELQNEDVVKITTSKNSPGPSREWLNIAKTAQAKNKIRAFFNRIDKEEYAKKGEELLNKELHKRKIPFSEFLTDENVAKIIKELKLSDMNEVYINIGNEKINVLNVISIINEKQETKEEQMLKKVSVKPKEHVIKNDIVIDGVDDVKLKLASCCKPIPGDEIIGYITKGYGISVHRMNCPNLDDLNERLIPVKWENIENKKYTTSIIIRTLKKENILLEIVSSASNNNINIEKINTYNNEDDMVFEMNILVENLEKLEKFINSLVSSPNILEVMRNIK